jgi:serine/threonine-protein kinase
MDAVEPIALPGTTNAQVPFFSPDSRWIGFFADGKLKKVAVDGGPPVTVCDADAGFGGTWGRDDTIGFAPTTASPLQRVSAGGGVPTRVTTLDTARGEFSHRWPEYVPGGATVLFTVGTEGEWDEAEIVAQSLDTGQRTKGGTHPHYLTSGHLAYTHGDAVWVVPFDAERLELTGPSVRALDGVAASVDGAAQFSASGTGAIVYLPVGVESARRLVVVEGAELTPLAAPVHGYVTPRVSPNGRRLLVGVADRGEHLWSYDMSAGTLTQITFEGTNRVPIWTADGLRVTFASNRGGALNLFVAPADGSGNAERLTTSENLQLPGSWSPDGSVLAFMEQHPESGRDIWLLDRDGQRTPLANTPSDESAPRFSPDGRWVAYVSDEAGQAEVYARPAPRRISSGGGREPVWRRDGRAIYYRAPDALMTVPVLDSAQLRLGPARAVPNSGGESGSFDAASYDVLPGEDRLLLIASAEQKTVTALQVVLHWAYGQPDP